MSDALGLLVRAASGPNVAHASMTNHLVAHGVDPVLADRTFRMAQTAFGRLLLDGLGITFSDEFYCFDAQGEVVERGRLSQDPTFIAAMALGGEPSSGAAVRALALASAEVNSVNKALNAGSDPKNLSLLPACFLMETPTDAGLERVRAFIGALSQAALHGALPTSARPT